MYTLWSAVCYEDATLSGQLVKKEPSMYRLLFYAMVWVLLAHSILSSKSFWG